MMQLPLFDAVEIPLTKGYFTLIDVIDAELAQLKWKVEIRPSGGLYASRTLCINTKHRHCALHRVILARKLGRELTRDEIADHIDGNGLNNRRSNLRLASSSQNSQNRKLGRANSSGFKGATWHKQRQKWQASIERNGKCIYLGLFDTAEEAHTAYCKAAHEFYGEFARIK